MSRFTEGAMKAQIRAKENGVNLRCEGGIAHASVTFEPGNRQAYCEAEGACLTVLARCIATQPGSTWGHDGVGGDIAMRAGRLTIHKSGIAPSFTKALAALQ